MNASSNPHAYTVTAAVENGAGSGISRRQMATLAVTLVTPHCKDYSVKTKLDRLNREISEVLSYYWNVHRDTDGVAALLPRIKGKAARAFRAILSGRRRLSS